ncbi:metallophosphoesterase [Candidatus Parcubacteria bacterium]|nr:metallophosphoesterase [Candidatus Parcubacteria bacterium]
MVKLTPRAYHLLIVFCGVLVISFGLMYRFASAPEQTPENEGAVHFVAVGDFGGSVDTAKVLKGIGLRQPEFMLGLGDLSYSEITPETTWCDFMRTYSNDTPIELIAGNHEGNHEDGYIDNFTKCLPDVMKSTGQFGKEYYFDYPAKYPLARFIMISPNIKFPDEVYEYRTPDSPHVKWLTKAIEDARADHIKWIIVGMHKVCITVGTKPCEVGHEVLDLLAKERVDLILQGHDHVYERSKQLICTKVPFVGNCVIESLDKHSYTKGQGPIIIITGTGGKSLSDTSATNANSQYFLTFMSQNAKPTKGFLDITLTEDELTGEFVPVTGENYSDYFTIQ